MNALSVKDILEASGGRLIKGNVSAYIHRFSTDTRTMTPGDTFIAIRGKRFDGHRFIHKACARQAGGIIAEDISAVPEDKNLPVIQVENTVKALGEIAKIWRRQSDCRIIAVTGTAGKTTTKDFTATVLAQRYCVHKTKGSLNNDIGVPLTLLGITAGDKAAVIEIGMNAPGEIGYLCGIAHPDTGIITNVGPAHLKQLGTEENIMAVKAELFAHTTGQGSVILNMDCPHFSSLRDKARDKIITIGRHKDADFQAYNISITSDGCARFSIKIKSSNTVLETELGVIGLHNVYPAMAACAAGYDMGLSPAEILEGLKNVRLPEGRLSLIETGGIKIINDCYNANPMSMKSALDVLYAIGGAEKKIFVCSDMLELGEKAPQFHEELGRYAAGCNIDRLITIGALSELVRNSAVKCGMPETHTVHCADKIEVVKVLGKWLEPGDVMLVKGSRANHLEEVIEGLKEYHNTLEQLII